MGARFILNSRIAQLLGVDAIVLYPFILVAGDRITSRLSKHELKHIRQIKTVGVFRFYTSYVMYYLSGRVAGRDHYDAYYEIPWEIEARAAE